MKCPKCGHAVEHHYILIDNPEDVFFPLCGCSVIEKVSRDVSAVDLPITYRVARTEGCGCQTRSKAVARKLGVKC